MTPSYIMEPSFCFERRNLLESCLRNPDYLIIELHFRNWYWELEDTLEYLQQKVRLKSLVNSVCKSNFRKHYDEVLKELYSKYINPNDITCVCCLFEKKSAFVCLTCNKKSICIDCFPKLNYKNCPLCRSNDIKQEESFQLNKTDVGLYNINENDVLNNCKYNAAVIKHKYKITQLKRLCRILVNKHNHTSLKGFSKINKLNRREWEGKIIQYLFKIDQLQNFPYPKINQLRFFSLSYLQTLTLTN